MDEVPNGEINLGPVHGAPPNFKLPILLVKKLQVMGLQKLLSMGASRNQPSQHRPTHLPGQPSPSSCEHRDPRRA